MRVVLLSINVSQGGQGIGLSPLVPAFPGFGERIQKELTSEVELPHQVVNHTQVVQNPAQLLDVADLAPLPPGLLQVDGRFR